MTQAKKTKEELTKLLIQAITLSKEIYGLTKEETLYTTGLVCTNKECLNGNVYFRWSDRDYESWTEKDWQEELATDPYCSKCGAIREIKRIGEVVNSEPYIQEMYDLLHHILYPDQPNHATKK